MANKASVANKAIMANKASTTDKTRVTDNEPCYQPKTRFFDRYIYYISLNKYTVLWVESRAEANIAKKKCFKGVYFKH